MSNFEVTINCRKCNIEFPFIHHGLIDIDEERELYNKIVNKTIFTFQCPKCGSESHLLFPFICYSKKRKFIILFSTHELKDDEKTNYIKDLGGDEIGNISNFTTRTVYTLEDLNEKIRIFENVLNDALIEAAKVWFIHNSDVNISEIRFYKVEDDFIHWIVFYGDNIKGARLPMDFYRDDEKSWKINIPNNFELVNQSTLDKFLTRIEK